MNKPSHQAVDPTAELLRFLESRTRVSFPPDADLFESGTVSSMFALELVVFLEGTFEVIIEGANLKLDNFRTVASMVALVDRLRLESAGDQSG